MALNIPIAQPISFDPKSCDDYCVLLRNPSLCDNDYIKNPTFLGTWGDSWTATNGTQLGTDPATYEIDITPIFTLTQSINITDGEYTVYWSFTKSSSSLIQVDLAISTGLVSTQIIAQTDRYIQGSVDITISGASAPDSLTLKFTPGVKMDLQLNYFYICQKADFVPSTDFCVQLPLEQVGSELLAVFEQEISFPKDFTLGVGYNDVEDSTGATCPGAPSPNNFNIINNVTETVSTTGEYFVNIDMGAVDIDYSLNPVTGDSQEVFMEAIDGVETTDITVGNPETNTNLITLSTNQWNAGDQPSLDIRSTQECDGTDLRRKWDITVNSMTFIPNFYVDTFTASDDTFYRLYFRLAKSSSCTVKIYDSNGVPIYQSTSDGIIFDKIFKTGTLPTTTVTIRWEITDLSEFPNTDYETSVLTGVTLYKMCDYYLQLVYGASAPFFVENHDFVVEAFGKTYNHNIEYCIDTTVITNFANYQAVATSKCDATKIIYGNYYTFCVSTCGLSEISWTRTNRVCVGNEILDYETYPATMFFWMKLSLQDLTLEEERIFYRGSDQFWNVAYTMYNTVEVLQLWELPAFMRKTIGLALADTFMINGIEYQKINDDDMSPQFNSVHESPMRILVAKVGDSMISRNV